MEGIIKNESESYPVEKKPLGCFQGIGCLLRLDPQKSLSERYVQLNSITKIHQVSTINGRSLPHSPSKPWVKKLIFFHPIWNRIKTAQLPCYIPVSWPQKDFFFFFFFFRKHTVKPSRNQLPVEVRPHLCIACHCGLTSLVCKCLSNTTIATGGSGRLQQTSPKN